MDGSRKHVIIIGGGASGTLLASHLLREGSSSVVVTLLEKRAEVGVGTAYSTDHPHHLLNVRASNMSAFPNEPDHFYRWLIRHEGHALADAPATFAPRRTYGCYLKSLLAPHLSGDSHRRLKIINTQATAVRPTDEGVVVQTEDGTGIAGDHVVLAIGYDEPRRATGLFCSPWARPANAGLAAAAPVLILGTGLTMVDVVLSLRSNGHSGPITALSRRGLMSYAHATAAPIPLDRANVPFGSGISKLTRWLRAHADAIEAEGGDWRSAIDSIRPFTAELWQRLPPDSRRRFLRHARAWWDIHRHRMAPSVATEVEAARSSGQLRLMAGRVAGITLEGDGGLVRVRRRGTDQMTTLEVARIFDCTGVSTASFEGNNPIVQSLISQNLGRQDALGIGLDVTPEGAVIGVDGTPSDRIFGVGPITRAAYWEMIAVPDIRNQSARLATHLLAA